MFSSNRMTLSIINKSITKYYNQNRHITAVANQKHTLHNWYNHQIWKEFLLFEIELQILLKRVRLLVYANELQPVVNEQRLGRSMIKERQFQYTRECDSFCLFEWPFSCNKGC